MKYILFLVLFVHFVNAEYYKRQWGVGDTTATLEDCKRFADDDKGFSASVATQDSTNEPSGCYKWGSSYFYNSNKESTTRCDKSQSYTCLVPITVVATNGDSLVFTYPEKCAYGSDQLRIVSHFEKYECGGESSCNDVIYDPLPKATLGNFLNDNENKKCYLHGNDCLVRSGFYEPVGLQDITPESCYQACVDAQPFIDMYGPKYTMSIELEYTNNYDTYANKCVCTRSEQYTCAQIRSNLPLISKGSSISSTLNRFYEVKKSTCLDSSVAVTVQNVNGNKYHFNGVNVNKAFYSLGLGTYTLLSVDQNHPLYLKDASSGISIYGTETHIYNNEVGYYGDVTIEVTGDFGKVQAACNLHGTMGLNYFKFSDQCVGESDSIDATAIEGATGTEDATGSSSTRPSVNTVGQQPVTIQRDTCTGNQRQCNKKKGCYFDKDLNSCEKHEHTSASSANDCPKGNIFCQEKFDDKMSDDVNTMFSFNKMKNVIKDKASANVKYADGSSRFERALEQDFNLLTVFAFMRQEPDADILERTGESLIKSLKEDGLTGKQRQERIRAIKQTKPRVLKITNSYAVEGTDKQKINAIKDIVSAERGVTRDLIQVQLNEVVEEVLAASGPSGHSDLPLVKDEEGPARRRLLQHPTRRRLLQEGGDTGATVSISGSNCTYGVDEGCECSGYVVGNDCYQHTECAEDEGEVSPPTATSNRVCAKINPCTNSSWVNDEVRCQEIVQSYGGCCSESGQCRDLQIEYNCRGCC